MSSQSSRETPGRGKDEKSLGTERGWCRHRKESAGGGEGTLLDGVLSWWDRKKGNRTEVDCIRVSKVVEETNFDRCHPRVSV